MVSGALEKALAERGLPNMLANFRPAPRASVNQRVEAHVPYSGYVDRDRVDCYKSRRGPDGPLGRRETGAGESAGE